MGKLKNKKVWGGLYCLIFGWGLGACGADEPAPSEPKAPVQSETKAPGSSFTLEQTLRLSVAERPDALVPRVQLANLYYDHKRFDEAVPLYLEALELDPINPSLRTDLGTCYVALKKFDEARVSYERVMLENPNHMQSVFNLGVVEKAQGNLLAAADLWDRAAGMAPTAQEAEQAHKLAARARKEASAASAKE